jgi:hypothetical protein
MLALMAISHRLTMQKNLSLESSSIDALAFAERRVADEEPQEGVRIEGSHYVYSSKSSSGSSKSSDIVISPLPMPNCGRGLVF